MCRHVRVPNLSIIITVTDDTVINYTGCIVVMSLTEEETNFLRLTILVIKLSPKAVRVLFDNKFPPTDLTNILQRKFSKLKILNVKKIINLAQWDLLYPANKGSGTFDLTLLICLLRNIATPAIRKPGTGFDQLPNNHDTTEGADLARIKYYRNLIAHNTDGTFNYIEFNTAWNDLSQAISRLGFGRYDQDCNDLRIACLDGSDREVYREVLNTNQKLEQLRIELKEEREKQYPGQSKIELTREFNDGKRRTKNTAIIEEWIRFEEDLKLLFDNTDMKLLINTRLIVSQDECFKMMLFLDDVYYVVHRPTVGLCLLKYSSCTFIRERVRLYGGQKYDDENIILLDSAYEDDYFKRMFADIMDGNIKDVFFNKQMQDRSFEDALVNQFKRMSDDDLEKMLMKRGNYSKACGNFLQRSNSAIVSFPNLTNSSDDMDEIAKFHLSYMNSLLYQEETSTFHWLMAQGLDRAFSYVLERFPKYVKEKIMQNYNLCVSLAALQGRTEILSELLMKYPCEAFEKDANDKRYYPIFIFVCFTGNLKLVKFLHMRDLIYPEKTESGESALWVAAYSGQIDVLEFLITNLKEFPFIKEFLINSVNKQYVTALFIASQRGHVEIVKLLLQNGADVNKCEADQIGLDIKGISPLFIACKIGNSKIVQFLLDHDADTEISTEIGKTPLFIALQNSHEEIARLLIEGKCNVNQSMANGYIPLTVVAGKGQVKIIQMLIDNGASVNISNHETISSKSIYVVKVLIQNGANIDYRGVEGATALFEASERGNIEVVKYLLSMKASVNIPTYRGRTPLFVAVQRRFLQIVTILIENNADVNLCREDGVSPLLRATIHGDAKLIELLLRNKADPNLATSEGLYPIMSAARQGHFEILVLILNTDAQIDAKNSKHQTPLWIAAFYGKKDCVQCLLDHRADINSTDQDEESVLLAACQQPDVSLIQCLVDAGSNVNLCNKRASVHCLGQ
ncbi:unnamed protein product [Mytilus edulis]|uniref:DZIP3-like HEPN domain-containing protein n=1 Tax=Mytilus edulis TaxID=6550 RepID=A0A8S3TVN2_MYTED|nr:unnamed protein product [Mytilus edulis]